MKTPSEMLKTSRFRSFNFSREDWQRPVPARELLPLIASRSHGHSDRGRSDSQWGGGDVQPARLREYSARQREYLRGRSGSVSVHPADSYIIPPPLDSLAPTSAPLHSVPTPPLRFPRSPDSDPRLFRYGMTLASISCVSMTFRLDFCPIPCVASTLAYSLLAIRDHVRISVRARST